MARISLVEVPVKQLQSAQAFYTSAFGWQLTDFGPTYTCTLTGDVDLGLQGDAHEATKAPLVVIQVDDLEAALGAVEKAGGVITRPIFGFPGGRRFHFADPNGLELAVFKTE